MTPEKRIKGIMANSLEVDEGLIGDDASIHTIAQWDSLQHLRLIMALQEEFSVRFQDVEIPELISFHTIRDAIMAKLTLHDKAQ
ncbi:MAG: acyl carrier protein [bacterium]|nr:acyl carrier protein [bacterium]